MKIAIGTDNKPKIEAIQECVESSLYFKNNLEYLIQKVDSKVSDMPLSIEEVMDGALNRVNTIVTKKVNADLYFGIERGAHRIMDKAYLVCATYIQNKKGEGHFGLSYLIEIPEAIDERMYLNGEELGNIMKELSGELKDKTENGSIYAWSDAMFNRKIFFKSSVKAALPPFFNKYYLY